MDETVDMGWELPDNHFENEDFLEPPSELKNKRILSTADYTLSAPLNKDGLNLCLDALISGKPVSQCKLIPGLLKDVGKLSELDINKWTQFARHDKRHSKVFDWPTKWEPEEVSVVKFKNFMKNNCQFLEDICHHFWNELGVSDFQDDLMSNLDIRGSERTSYLKKAFGLQMVDIINCLSEYDLENARKTFYEYKKVENVEMAVTADINSIGRVILVQGWVVMVDLNMLTSRDMLLMVKDMMFA